MTKPAQFSSTNEDGEVFLSSSSLSGFSEGLTPDHSVIILTLSSDGMGKVLVACVAWTYKLLC